MEFTDIFNDYYKKYPPKKTIDDEGIFHFKEIDLPAAYQKCPCKCGIIHKDHIATWYHTTMKICEDPEIPHKVIKKCKICQETLLLELAQPLKNNNSSNN